MSRRPVALITGAGCGIGRAIAIELAVQGFDIVLTDVKVGEDLADTSGLAEKQGAKTTVRRLDIADTDGHASFLQTLQKESGPLACLVNNAGVSVLRRDDLLEVRPESFDHCIRVNLRGTFFLTQAFARLLISQSDKDRFRSIITITSSNVHAVSVTRGEYCISKAGLSMASRLFAVRLANDNIGVFEVQPGIITTKMTAPAKAKYDAAIEQGLTAIKRWGTPEDVAIVVGTMATGRLPYTVGQAVAVDGGLLTPRF
jgi:NAD(P)-dependent dehydrogenase (short-subunit alcohol dehydrogenase family)